MDSDERPPSAAATSYKRPAGRSRSEAKSPVLAVVRPGRSTAGSAASRSCGIRATTRTAWWRAVLHHRQRGDQRASPMAVFDAHGVPTPPPTNRQLASDRVRADGPPSGVTPGLAPARDPVSTTSAPSCSAPGAGADGRRRRRTGTLSLRTVRSQQTRKRPGHNPPRVPPSIGASCGLAQDLLMRRPRTTRG